MQEPDYKIGQLIKHKLFDYRGVILNVDDSFKSTEEWYNNVAKAGLQKINHGTQF